MHRPTGRRALEMGTGEDVLRPPARSFDGVLLHRSQNPDARDAGPDGGGREGEVDMEILHRARCFS
ncbi:MAG: hypothetical protein IT379_00970 [Deltaproteobacteria bacterium]|nr:hypothetical protein [Deltaproteobacteria bacterium]